ncbi:MAG: hypothetical protein R3C11_26520 [Planctomycetaceae bacterium]
MNLDYSIDKAKRELGYDPQIDFQEAMKETMDWFKEQAYEESPVPCVSRNSTAYHVRIPLKKEIRQAASYNRRFNDTVVVRCELNDGNVGWGEGLPRHYVTGETIETVWKQWRSLHYRINCRAIGQTGLNSSTGQKIDLKRPDLIEPPLLPIETVLVIR